MQQNFEEREIGRYVKIPGPARSPDLTPMDFFVWGWVKDQVYRQPVDSLDELKVRIAQTMNGMPLDYAAHSLLLSFKSRLQSCINNEGRHVEH